MERPSLERGALEDEGRRIERLSTLSEALTDLLERTPAEPGEDPREILDARTDLYSHFERFPRLVPAMVHALRDALERHGWDPGTVEAVLVGGRLRGTPLKAGSDIDILFFFERPIGPAIRDGVARQAWIALRRELLFTTFRGLCEAEGIFGNGGYPGRFQFLHWGERPRCEVLPADQPANDALSLYTA